MAKRRTGGTYAINITVSGEKEIQDAIKRFEKNAASQAKAFEEISLLITEKEKKDWGRGWAPEAESTKIRKAEGNSQDFMKNTGDLYRSLTEPYGPNTIREITPHGMRWGSKLFYGRIQASGTKTGLPKRRMLRIPRTAIIEILHHHIMEGVNNARH